MWRRGLTTTAYRTPLLARFPPSRYHSTAHAPESLPPVLSARDGLFVYVPLGRHGLLVCPAQGKGKGKRVATLLLPRRKAHGPQTRPGEISCSSTDKIALVRCLVNPTLSEQYPVICYTTCQLYPVSLFVH